MEIASLCHSKTHPITITTRLFPKWSQISNNHHLRMIPSSSPSFGGLQSHGMSANVAAVWCMAMDSELSDEMRPEEEEEEWMGVGRLRNKCKEEGMVEVMECLENEAIMGDDHGREAGDYHRRAQLFDMSSRIFQTLKSHQQS